LLIIKFTFIFRPFKVPQKKWQEATFLHPLHATLQQPVSSVYSQPHYIAGLNQVQGICLSKYAMDKKCILMAVKLMKRYPVNCLCGS